MSVPAKVARAPLVRNCATRLKADACRRLLESALMVVREALPFAALRCPALVSASGVQRVQ
eukprot:11216107-Lingulodinium_polyedra.AAC.1